MINAFQLLILEGMIKGFQILIWKGIIRILKFLLRREWSMVLKSLFYTELSRGILFWSSTFSTLPNWRVGINWRLHDAVHMTAAIFDLVARTLATCHTLYPVESFMRHVIGYCFWFDNLVVLGCILLTSRQYNFAEMVSPGIKMFRGRFHLSTKDRAHNLFWMQLS